eukprot:14232061-Alexandrium_andersonii.AAC.1
MRDRWAARGSEGAGWRRRPPKTQGAGCEAGEATVIVLTFRMRRMYGTVGMIPSMPLSRRDYLA